MVEISLNQLKKLQDLRKQKGRFLHFIKQEKNYFIDKIDDAQDLCKIICVRAKLNNQRIIRQNGLFFLFGMGYAKSVPIIFLKDVHNHQKIKEITKPTIIISGQAKQRLLTELRTLGICEETLMPEIDIVARSLKDRYNH